MPRFMEKICERAGTSAIAALLIAGMTWGGSSLARAAEGHLHFMLVAVDVAPDTDGVKPLLVLSGNGSFTSGWVKGGGSYTYADVATEIPKTILSTGTWKATEVLKWTPSEGGATYGRIRPGVLDLRIDLMPEQGPVIKGATLRINCNVGLAGIKNKDADTGEDLAEGFWLTIPATASFGPTSSVGQFVPKDPILGITEINL
ncbi:MAG: hypothetical protein IH786_10165 [Proteobacteria bacterium]|nr:hypothetical protein [Pseudomonadota bacterium]